MLDATVKYGKRLIRMTSLLATRQVRWTDFKMSLRPGQVAVLDAAGGMLFCDEETEDMFFR